MEDILKSEFLVKSAIKIAQKDGVPIYIRKKGDLDAGIILIKIDLLNGTSKLLRRNLNFSVIKNEKIRPKPTKPELLPLEVATIEKKIKERIDLNLSKDSKIAEEKLNFKEVKKNIKTSNKNILLYRVQFGSFRDLNKAKLAKKNIEKKYTNLLLKTELEIFSYTNNDNILFHRVWTTSMNKDNGLILCEKFKKEKIVCILQVNKRN